MEFNFNKIIKILTAALAGALEDGKLTPDDLPEALITIIKESMKSDDK